MTTAYQTVFDNATTISINKRKTVAQTVSRDGTVRGSSMGGQKFTFEVALPAGPKYSDYRSLIEKMETLDKTTVATVNLADAGHDYISGYLGDFASPNSVQVNFTSGNTLTITSNPEVLTSGQFKFKAGDFIQLGSNSVYTVADDVAHDSDTITVHRPVLEAAGLYTVNVGQSVNWQVICVNFPQWEIFGYDQVRWQGKFIFAESV